jgi:prepilin-type N-terminal cleavage/methylation domain-containing protein
MKKTGKQFSKPRSRRNGFSLIEMLVVTTIAVILMAIAVPNYQRISQNLRIGGDMRDLNGIVAQAKMNAAADFTHARARANLTTNTFQLEIWDKTNSCWRTVGDSANTCTKSTSPVVRLSTGVSFGFDNVGTAPTNTQATIKQAAPCGNGPAGTASNTKTIDDTACIEFNSRGIPLDKKGNPDGTGAFYVNDGQMVFGLTMGITGNSQIWAVSDASSTPSWMHR